MSEIKGSVYQLAHSSPESLELISDCRVEDHPPKYPLEVIPEYFTHEHAVVYVILSVYQQASPDGFRDYVEAMAIYQQVTGCADRAHIKRLVAEVIVWSQKLKPRQVKPSVFSLLWLAKSTMSDGEIQTMMGHIHRLGELNEDLLGMVSRFIRWLDCFFMDNVHGAQPGIDLGSEDPTPCVLQDPEGWTILHDLSTMMLYFNYLRGHDIDDLDELSFRIAIPNMNDGIEGVGVGNASVDPSSPFQLLDEVAQLLFLQDEPGGINRDRLVKSHQSLIAHYMGMSISESEMKSALFQIYRAMLSEFYLTHDQKLTFKRWLLCWNQYMDLGNLIDVIDYHLEEGQAVFVAIDDPDRPRGGQSIERFCCG